ncbi:hypothetical protein N7478_010950 [Penicillium angulare]|uniref:uncharacterized protein n=1 Tax=Penicillium angulare TaxID=116970 RepID=UPI002541C481|nr:uncharacterized protein N7478_010950 [Penicillium angulare]KAJ5263345.1 hypothetical protein N7478_010950 [Penicillium angulare]
MPEANLPGLNIDFSLLDIIVGENMSQKANLWAKSPSMSNSSTSRLSIHLDLGSDDILSDGHILDIVNEETVSTRKRSLFGIEPSGVLGNEEGILLQPDFEFDENGAIFEFDASHLSPRKRRKFTAQQVDDGFVVFDHNEDSMDLTADMAFVGNGDTEMTKLDGTSIHEQQIIDLTGEEPLNQNQNQNQSVEHELIEPVIQRQVRHRIRIIKYIDPDNTTTVRNSDLAQWNNEYTSNMAYASNQKQQNKIQTTSKKNAAFYVYGQGIGYVGIGLGQNKKDHPLKCFSGISLFNALCRESEQLTTPKKPGRPSKDPDTEVETDTEVHRNGNGGPQTKRLDSLDIEIGRHAPSSLLDEQSILMPWNIIASAQSSRIAHLGSLGDLSAKFGETSLLRHSHSRRLTSASPLAGRGYLDPSERQGSLSLLVDDGIGAGVDFFNEDLETTRYLEGELATDRESIQAFSRRVSAIQRVAGQLDQESLNFFEFIQEKMGSSNEREGQMEMRFSELLAPESTSRVVATQGLMNVLTLATKGVLRVRQERYKDTRVDILGDRYRYGEIFMRM